MPGLKWNNTLKGAKDQSMTPEDNRIRPVPIAISCLIFVAAPMASPAGQSDTASISDCQSIQDDAARLACYDRIAAPTPPAAAPVPPPTEKTAAPAATEAAPVAPAAEKAAAPVQPPAEEAVMPAAAEPAPVKQSPEESVIPAAEEQATVAASPPAEQQVLTDEIGRETISRKDGGQGDISVRGRVASCAKGRSGKYVFYFDNGQVWRQKGNLRLSWKECEFDVTISKDFFGYKMVRDGDRKKVRIERIE
jgi:hypothetical protein